MGPEEERADCSLPAVTARRGSGLWDELLHGGELGGVVFLEAGVGGPELGRLLAGEAGDEVGDVDMPAR